MAGPAAYYYSTAYEDLQEPYISTNTHAFSPKTTSLLQLTTCQPSSDNDNDNYNVVGKMTLQNLLSSRFFFFLCFFQRYCCMVLVNGVVWFGMVWYASFAGLVTPSAMAMNQRTIDRPEKDRRCRSAALQLATRSPRRDRFQFGEFGAAEKLVLSQSTHNLQHDDRRRKVQ